MTNSNSFWAPSDVFIISLLQNIFSLAISDEDNPDSEEPSMKSNLCRSNDNCLAEQRLHTPFNDDSRQLICNEHISRLEREDFLKGTSGTFFFQLGGERSVLLECGNVHIPPSLLPTSSIVQVSKCLKLMEIKGSTIYTLKQKYV